MQHPCNCPTCDNEREELRRLRSRLNPGDTIKLGWNGAKLLGCEQVAYDTVRVEAVGADWVVVRIAEGAPLAATFGPHDDMKTELES